MPNIRVLFTALLRDESGQDLIEYSLLASFVALGAVASVKAFAVKLATSFGTIGNTLTSST
ncbi:MAG: Flp family type IVb pilin [Acidobacteriota bacterium]